MLIFKRRSLYVGLLFFLYMYAFMMTLTFADTKAAELLSSPAAVRLHYIDYLFLFAGLSSCALFAHKLTLLRKQLLFGLTATAYVLFLLLLYIPNNPSGLALAAVMLSLLLGIAGSLTYFLMAVNLKDSGHTGLVMALSSSCAVLLQRLTTQTGLTYAALLLVGTIGAVWSITLFYRRASGLLEWELSNADQRQPAPPDKRQTRILISVIVIILCLEFIAGFNDGFNVRLFSQGTVDLYGWPRLLMVPAFLLAGFLADYKERRFFTVSVIGIFMMSVFAPIFLMDKRFYILNLCLFYPYLAFLITFINVTFWDIAAQSRRPELYAPLGRIIDCATSIIFSFWHINNYYVCIAIQLVLLVIAWVMLIWQNQQHGSAALPSPAGVKTLEDFLNAFNLTDKERELAGIVLTQDVGMKEVAAMVYSSERGIYRHLKQIYVKTGTDSRTGLLIRYHEFIAGEYVPEPADRKVK